MAHKIEVKKKFSPKVDRKHEAKFYGKALCKELFSTRQKDIIKVYLLEENVKPFSELLKFCSQNKKAYQIVKLDSEMQKISGSDHHEGICIVAKEKQILKFDDLIQKLKSKPKKKELILYLDDVQNPHNLGALARTCAHFGVRFIGGHGITKHLSGASARVSEGGSEFVEFYDMNFPHLGFRKLKELGFKVYSTAVRKDSKTTSEIKFHEKSVLVLGSESRGVSQEIEKQSDETLYIQGTKNVESLNVSVTGGILIHEYQRQNP